MYSVLGFLETLGLLETVIRKLLQNLLHPIVIIFRSIYIYARDPDKKSCLSQKNLCHRNYEKVRFWSIITKCKGFAPKDNWVTSNIYFIYMTEYLGILPTSKALNQVISSKMEPTMRFGKA